MIAPPPLVPVLEFLEGKGKDASGRSIDDVLAFDDDALETNHDFIQWLFPLPEPSRAQPSSPILTVQEVTAIRASSAAQENLKNSSEDDSFLSADRSLAESLRSQSPPHHPHRSFLGLAQVNRSGAGIFVGGRESG
jgi:hypothetical protein